MELLRRAKTEQVDFLREALHKLAQALMQLEVTQHLHAERYEQTDQHTGHRNGSRVLSLSSPSEAPFHSPL